MESKPTHIIITEENEWEGEIWEHVIPYPSNPDELAAIELLPDVTPWFTVDATNEPPIPYDSGRGYLAECMHLHPSTAGELLQMFESPGLSQGGMDEKLYKGQIRHLATGGQ